MAMAKSDKQFEIAMCARVKAARKALGLTQVQMAEELGIEWTQYQKYEGKSPMKHELLPKFCRLTGFDPWYFLTGQGSFRPDD